MVTVRQAPKYYYLELMGALALYIPSIIFRRGFVAGHPGPSTLKTAVLMLPLLPTLLMALAIWRFYTRMDEMQRRVTLEDFAFGGLFCALASLTLGFTNGSDVPHIDIFWAWPLMGAGWLFASTARLARCMVRDRGWRATARQAAILALLVGLPTLAYFLVAVRLGWPHRPGFILLVATAVIIGRAGWAIFRREPK